MPRPACTDQQFVETWQKLKSATKVARSLGVSERAVHMRRNAIENRTGIALLSDDSRSKRVAIDRGAVFQLGVDTGTVLVCSDVHIWPGELTTTQRAFIAFCERFKKAGSLKAVIVNGDVFDGARISRHPSIGWESKPTVKRELEAVADWLGQVTKAAGSAMRLWPAGNHDLRYETRIANAAPEYEGVNGMHLKDHMPEWTPCWRVDINDDVIVKHRMRGGEHADWNNVIKSGKTTVTGHDHRLGVKAYADYRGLRWGVRCGFMGESPLDEQFVHYMEADEPNWWPGFVLLTFKNGRLLWPEIVSKHDDEHVEFRGEVVHV